MEARRASGNEQACYVAATADNPAHAVTSGSHTVTVHSLTAHAPNLTRSVSDSKLVIRSGLRDISHVATPTAHLSHKSKSFPFISEQETQQTEDNISASAAITQLSLTIPPATYESMTFILRGQPPHIGHIRTIKLMCKKTYHVIIVLGSTNEKRTQKNPFTFDERKIMLTQCIDIIKKDYPYTTFSIIGLKDYDINEQWRNALVAKVNSTHADFDKPAPPSITKKQAITGYKKDESSYYLNDFPEWELELVDCVQYNNITINATDIRKLLFRKFMFHHVFNETEQKYLCDLLPDVVRHWLDKNPQSIASCTLSSDSL